MIRTKMKFVLCFMVLVNSVVMAQNKSLDQQEYIDYSKNPEWIKMIDNPGANYYEAVKAYDIYWKGKAKPDGEDDVNEHASRKEKREHKLEEKQLAKMSVAERSNYDELNYQCKRFETWKREVFPYVQEDGRILSQQERIEIWNKQQEEIRKQNQK